MTSGSESSPNTPGVSPVPKQPWVTPKLTVHGDIVEVTKKVGTVATDGVVGSILP